jgi:hypothetical protein
VRVVAGIYEPQNIESDIRAVIIVALAFVAVSFVCTPRAKVREQADRSVLVA